MTPLTKGGTVGDQEAKAEAEVEAQAETEAEAAGVLVTAGASTWMAVKRLDELDPAPYNPRTITAEALAGLRRSIEEFGLVEPIIWNKRTGHVVGGHQRLKALQALGVQETTVVMVDLDETREKALNLSLNNPAIQGEFTEDVKILLEEQAIAFPEMFDGLRFDVLDEVAEESFPREEYKGEKDPDAVPQSFGDPRTKRGDMWVLGNHRLMCGDATDRVDVATVLSGLNPMPTLMVTDPPYGVDYDPAWRQRAAEEGHLAYAACRVGQVPNDDRDDWTEAWRHFPGDVIYCWHADRHASHVQRNLETAKFEIRNQIIWAKPHMPISRGHYHWRHEPCWYAVREGSTAHWIGDRTQTTLWEVALDVNVAGGHSTQKPVECMARPLRNHSGDVYDPFVGSGTTIIAAEMVSRTCYAMDINPHYCDVAIKRWEEFTGRTAQLVRKGEEHAPTG